MCAPLPASPPPPDRDRPLARVGWALGWPLRLVMIGGIRFYRLALSPLLPPTCRFTPTCSAYALEAVRRYGALRGGLLATWRVLRCNPWGGSGYDPPRWPSDPAAPRATDA